MQDTTQALPSPDLVRETGSFERWVMSEVAGIPVAFILCAGGAALFGLALAWSSSGRW